SLSRGDHVAASRRWVVSSRIVRSPSEEGSREGSRRRIALAVPVHTSEQFGGGDQQGGQSDRAQRVGDGTPGRCPEPLVAVTAQGHGSRNDDHRPAAQVAERGGSPLFLGEVVSEGF